VIVPLQCEFYACSKGLPISWQTIEQGKTGLQTSRLNIQGVVLTMYDKRNNSAPRCGPTCADISGRRFTDRDPRNRQSPRRRRRIGKPVLLYALDIQPLVEDPFYLLDRLYEMGQSSSA